MDRSCILFIITLIFSSGCNLEEVEGPVDPGENTLKACFEFTLDIDYCAGIYKATFDPSCSVEGIQYEWNFGDGNEETSTGEIQHIYEAPGDYQVSLLIRNADQVEADTLVNISIQPPNNKFAKQFPSNEIIDPQGIAIRSDQNYLLLWFSALDQITVSVIDLCGEIIEEKQFDLFSKPAYLVRLPNETFAIVGRDNGYVKVINIDESLAVIDEKTYLPGGLAVNNIITSTKLTTDGTELIITGKTNATSQFFVLSIDSESLDEVCSQSFSINPNITSTPWSGIKANSNGYILTGESSGGNGSDKQFNGTFLLTTNSSCELNENHTLNPNTRSKGTELISLSSTGYYLLQTKELSTSDFAIAITQLDENLVEVDELQFEVGNFQSTPASRKFKYNSEGNFIVFGVKENNANDLFFFETNGFSSSTDWAVTYDLSNNQGAIDFQSTADGGYIFLGNTLESPIPAILIKTDANGNYE